MCGVLLSGDEMLNSTGQCFDSAVVSVWMLGLISYTPPPTCCRLFICSNYSPNCSLDVFPVFIYNGGWQRWLWLGGEMHSCWSELLFAVHRLRANTYQFSKLHGTKPSKNERLHRCFEFKIPIET